MIREIKRFMASMFLAVFSLVFFPGWVMTVYAASAKIEFSDHTVTVGNEQSVTLKITSAGGEALGGYDIMLSYDSGLLEFIGGDNANGGSAGKIRVVGSAASADTTVIRTTLKFKALSAGSAKITVDNPVVLDMNTQEMTVDKVGSSAITITPLSTQSKEASLASLNISPGNLTPAFSPDVESYTTTVNVEKIIVDAPAKDSKAKVIVTGNDGLQIGENTVTCKVVAEDGQTSKNYTILVTRVEGEVPEENSQPDGAGSTSIGDLKVKIGDEEYGVATSFDEALLPEGFEASEFTYKGNQIMAGVGLEKALTLMYLSDTQGSGKFYIYTEPDVFTEYVQLDTIAKSIVIVPLDEGVSEPAGMVKDTITYYQQKFTGWLPSGSETNPEYCVVYAMNWKGEKHFYRYDLVENTMQRYFESDSAAVSQEDLEKIALYDELSKDYDVRFWIIMALIAVAVILFALVVVLLFKKSSGDGNDRDELDDDYDDDDDIREIRQERKIPQTHAPVYHEPVEEEPVRQRAERGRRTRVAADEMEDRLSSRRGLEERPIQSAKNPAVNKQSEDEDDDFEFFDLDI